MIDVLLLVSSTEAVDAWGDPVITETKRSVFCEVSSIGAKEFYQAAASGLQPEIKFTLADYYDYTGEKLVEYDGERYHVLRTYRKGQQLELTCYREVNKS